MDRRTARTNRIGLALVGILLIIGGGLALARGLHRLPGLPAAQPLLNPAARAYARDHAWFWYAVAAAAVLITLLALRWLVVQARTGAVRRLRVPGDTAGRTRLPAHAATKALTTDIEHIPSVRRATAQLTGSPSAPRLNLYVTADSGCDWPQLRHDLTTDALTRLRAALDRDHLPTRLRVRLTTTAPTRDVR